MNRTSVLRLAAMVSFSGLLATTAMAQASPAAAPAAGQHRLGAGEVGGVDGVVGWRCIVPLGWKPINTPLSGIRCAEIAYPCGLYVLQNFVMAGPGRSRPG